MIEEKEMIARMAANIVLDSSQKVLPA